jgi:tetratricopeptide (TPR) repeat protein
MNDLANLYIQIGNFEKARHLLHDSLAIHLQFYDETNANSSWLLYNLGVVNGKLGNVLEGINYLNKSYTNHLAYYQNDYVIKRDLVELANLYIDIGQYDQAETILKQAIPEYIKQFGGAHHKVAKVYNYLARLYLFKNKNDDAMNYIRKSVAILKKEQHPELYISYEYIAEYYLKNFNVNNALKYIINAEKVLHKHYPSNSDLISRIQELKDKTV